MSMENPPMESLEKKIELETGDMVRIINKENKGMEGEVFLVNNDGTVDVILNNEQKQRVKENGSNLEKIKKEQEPVEGK